MSRDPVALLRRHLGYPGFRPGQVELVRSVLAGRDALGILPLGVDRRRFIGHSIPATDWRLDAIEEGRQYGRSDWF